jgi:Co/Zn/Cd efflux system component
MGGTHDHLQVPQDFGKALAIGTALNLAYVVVQVLSGVFAHSLALLADAGHNLGDVLGLLLAWGATKLAKTRPTTYRTYGLRRSSILAALANAAFLLIAVGGITWEAIRRLRQPAGVTGSTMIWVAAIGVVLNTLTAMLFMSGRKAVHDLHIWPLSTTETALTVHIVKPDGIIDDSLLCRLKDGLHDRFHIAHVTVQLERGDAAHPCEQEPEHVV